MLSLLVQRMRLHHKVRGVAAGVFVTQVRDIKFDAPPRAIRQKHCANVLPIPPSHHGKPVNVLPRELKVSRRLAVCSAGRPRTPRAGVDQLVFAARACHLPQPIAFGVRRCGRHRESLPPGGLAVQQMIKSASANFGAQSRQFYSCFRRIAAPKFVDKKCPLCLRRRLWRRQRPRQSTYCRCHARRGSAVVLWNCRGRGDVFSCRLEEGSLWLLAVLARTGLLLHRSDFSS